MEKKSVERLEITANFWKAKALGYKEALRAAQRGLKRLGRRHHVTAHELSTSALINEFRRRGYQPNHTLGEILDMEIAKRRRPSLEEQVASISDDLFRALAHVVPSLRDRHPHALIITAEDLKDVPGHDELKARLEVLSKRVQEVFLHGRP